MTSSRQGIFAPKQPGISRHVGAGRDAEVRVLERAAVLREEPATCPLSLTPSSVSELNCGENDAPERL